MKIPFQALVHAGIVEDRTGEYNNEQFYNQTPDGMKRWVVRAGVRLIPPNGIEIAEFWIPGEDSNHKPTMLIAVFGGTEVLFDPNNVEVDIYKRVSSLGEC